jgi:hypothetical protein
MNKSHSSLSFMEGLSGITTMLTGRPRKTSVDSANECPVCQRPYSDESMVDAAQREQHVKECLARVSHSLSSQEGQQRGRCRYIGLLLDT